MYVCMNVCVPVTMDTKISLAVLTTQIANEAMYAAKDRYVAKRAYRRTQADVFIKLIACSGPSWANIFLVL